MNRFLIIMLAWVILSLGPATTGSVQADTVVAEPSPPPTTPAPPLTVQGPMAEESALDGFNRAMHGFNRWVWDVTDTGASWVSFLAPPQAVREALRNMLLNYINEPLSMLSWAVAGDYANASVAAHRFWINTTDGWLGAQDVATAQGLKVPQIDIGLALCARGVGEGGYIVLPFVGPRTYRDGLSDFLLINGLTYLALAPAVGFPPSLQSFTVIEVTEEAWRIAVMRQIDHGDDRNASLKDLREKYLASRRERCAGIIADRDQKSGSGQPE